jgi:hypothetical protein
MGSSVGRLRDDMADMLDDGEWFLSGGVRCYATGPMHFGLARLREVSLCRRSANLNTALVRWTPTAGQPQMPLPWRACWDRAHEAMSSCSYAYQRSSTLRMSTSTS